MQIQYSVFVSAPQRVTLVPDPCTLLIDGVTFGITSTDILFHMGAEEISWWEMCLNSFPFFFPPNKLHFCCWYSFFFYVYSGTRSSCLCISEFHPCNWSHSVLQRHGIRPILSYTETHAEPVEVCGGSWRVLVLPLMALAQRYWHPCFCFTLTASTRCTHPWRTLTWIMRGSRALVRCPSPPMFSSFHLSCVIL